MRKSAFRTTLPVPKERAFLTPPVQAAKWIVSLPSGRLRNKMLPCLHTGCETGNSIALFFFPVIYLTVFSLFFSRVGFFLFSSLRFRLFAGSLRRSSFWRLQLMSGTGIRRTWADRVQDFSCTSTPLSAHTPKKALSVLTTALNTWRIFLLLPFFHHVIWLIYDM